MGVKPPNVTPCLLSQCAHHLDDLKAPAAALQVATGATEALGH